MFLTGWFVGSPRHPHRHYNIHKTISEAILNAVSGWKLEGNRDRKWEQMKRLGYRCFKVKVTGAPNERT